MLFPIADDDRRLTRPAYVTWSLVAANVIVFVLFQGLGTNEAFTYGYSVIPFELLNGRDLITTQQLIIEGEAIPIPQAPGPTPIYLTVLTSMFMHGGFMHLFGNLLYLWIFGDNVEQRFGARRFLGFYLASGLAATFIQFLLNPVSVVPNLGASGAISGVLGAYLVLFPRNRVYTLTLFGIIAIPALWALGIWIVFQIFEGLQAATMETAGGVAYGAHIGGFVAGLLAGLVARSRLPAEPRHAFSRVAEQDGSRRYW